MLNRMEASATSQNNRAGLPDIDSYTALMNALLDQQNNLISNTEHIGNENQLNDDNGALNLLALAEKAHNLLIQMENLSGVSDHYSPMGSSGSIDGSIRNTDLRPTSHHYDCVINAFANASTVIKSNLTKNAPYIAQRWLQRMETLAFDQHSGVTPTVDSYYHVMEAFSANGASHKLSKAPFLTQAVFDKLKQNTDLRPTAREYRLLLRTWCSSSSKDAAYNATGLWMTMQSSLKGGIEEMEPTLEDGKTVLEAWSRAM